MVQSLDGHEDNKMQQNQSEGKWREMKGCEKNKQEWKFGIKVTVLQITTTNKLELLWVVWNQCVIIICVRVWCWADVLKEAPESRPSLWKLVICLVGDMRQSLTCEINSDRSPLPPGRAAFRRWQPEESSGEGEAGSFPHASLHPSGLSEPPARHDWSGRHQEADGERRTPPPPAGEERPEVFHQWARARFAFSPSGPSRLNLAELQILSSADNRFISGRGFGLA